MVPPRIAPRVVRVLVAFHDLTLSAAAFFSANIIAFGWIYPFSFPNAALGLVAFTVIAALSLQTMKLNRGLWRYASIPEFAAMVKAATMAVAGYTIMNFFYAGGEYFSRIATVLTWVFMIFGLGAGRLLFRYIKETGALHFGGAPRQNREHYLLFPFCDATENYIRTARRLGSSAPAIAGIIDNRAGLLNSKLLAVDVLGQDRDIGKIVHGLRESGYPVTQLVVTSPSVPENEMRSLLDACVEAHIGLSRISGAQDVRSLEDSGSLRPSPISINDLISRPSVRLPSHGAIDTAAGKRVLVTGAGGTIGSELCRQLAEIGPETLILADHSEFHLYKISLELQANYPRLDIKPVIVDVREAMRVRHVFEDLAPQLVFHTAALKHVSVVEDNPVEGIKTNVLGTLNIAQAAHDFKAERMVSISTDKAVEPKSVMGVTKKVAEMLCQSFDRNSQFTRYSIVRFGNVIGSNGSVVPLFQEQIKRGGPVTITHPKVTRYFMTIPEAVRLVLHSISTEGKAAEKRGSILVLNMGDPVSIDDLARKMIALSGARADIDIPVKYVGLRKGEKIREELFGPKEMVEQSPDGSFFVASSVVAELRLLMRAIADVEKACVEDNAERALLLISRLIPGDAGKAAETPPIAFH